MDILSLKRCYVLVALGVWGIGPGHAADVYRWVDAQGRVQLSDRVPEEYKNSATRVDTSASQLTPAQQREAQERAGQEKARAAEAAAREARVRVPQAAQPAAGVGAAPAKEGECATARRLFQQNANCLAPYKIANGGFKPGAFETCGASVPAPPDHCGAP
jgi:hypothetical protein